MRGNPYSRGFDPMKSRSERRKEKQVKLSKTKRVIRLKKRLGRIAARKFAAQEDSHMTALMESYITRRKAERAAERAKENPEGAAAAAAGSSGGSDEDAYASGDDDEDGGSDSEAFSLGSGADSAFEMDGDEKASEEEVNIAASRRRAALRKREGGAARGRGRGGSSSAPSSWAAKKDVAGFAGKRGRGGRGGGGGAQRGFSRGRGAAAGQRGGRGGAPQRTNSATRFQDRSRQVQTRSLY